LNLGSRHGYYWVGHNNKLERTQNSFHLHGGALATSLA
jgi:hypothetical protein